jgi:glycosyltransferase involved in cell wall biosynthesis
MGKKLSVVIPCFNHGEFVSEAVESVKQVRRDDVELIVVDDGSTDDLTRKAMDQLSSEGVFVIRQKNGGLAAARNAGIRAAQGEYILPLDADNRIRAAYIAHGVRILDRDSDVGVVYGDANFFGLKKGPWHVGKFDIEKLLRFNYIDACAIFRRVIWEQNKGYDATMPFQGLEDWDFWLGAVKNKWRFTYVPESLFDYRVLQNSMVTRTYSRHVEIMEFILVKHAALFAPEWLRIGKERRTVKGTLRHAIKLIKLGVLRKARIGEGGGV